LAKIIFITSRFPYPLNKGDKLRVFFQLKYLSEKFEIHLIALEKNAISKDHYDAVLPYCKSIHIFIIPVHKRIFQLILSPIKKIPLQVAYFYNRKINKTIISLINEVKPDYIHCHLIRTTEYVKGIENISKSLDFMDSFGKGMEKRQLIESNVFKRLLFCYEKNQLFRYENHVFDFIDKFAIISEQDKNSIKSPRVNEIYIIPNGVDFDSFYPRFEDKKYDILFMGNLGYPPNIEAVMYLSNKIMPILKTHKPKIKLLIAGINAPNRIKKLQSENIDVIENFKNISDSIAISRIMLAPMQISIGLQNKILQAMAMQTPCIVSTVSNNAIKAPINKAIIEANTPQEYSKNIIELLNNEERANEIGLEGFRFVKEKYSWEIQNLQFIKVLLG
jgi:glycosyltransferase involved in cell wall biosynthesis